VASGRSVVGAAYSAFAGAGSGLADFPEGEAGGGGTKAKHQSEKGLSRHVKESLRIFFIMAPGAARCDACWVWVFVLKPVRSLGRGHGYAGWFFTFREAILTTCSALLSLDPFSLDPFSRILLS